MQKSLGQLACSATGYTAAKKLFPPHCNTKALADWQSQILFWKSRRLRVDLIFNIHRYSIYDPYMIHSDPIIRILAEPWLPGEEPRARA